MSITKYIKEFTKYYIENSIRKHQDTDFGEDKLRVSGLPYCGLRHLYRRLIHPKQYYNMGKSYYMDCGTLTHSAIQKHLGFGNKIIGDWVCIEEFCLGYRKFSSNCYCPACGLVMEYKELEMKFDMYPYLSKFFIDGLFVSEDGSYWIIDYKTTNSKTCSIPTKDSGLPYATNVAQIKAYCALIEKLHPIKIKGWLLCYVARDNPLTMLKVVGNTISNKEKSNVLNNLKKYNDQYKKVMFCNSFKTVKELYENKPCISEEYYRNNYATFDPCPFVHLCFDHKMAMKELTRAWETKPTNFWSWKRPPNLRYEL